MKNLFEDNPAGVLLMPPSRRNGPAESKAAAASMIHAAATQRLDVLKLIEAAGERGLTDQEGAAAAGLEGNSYVPRRWELAKMGLIQRTGQRRATRSGRSAAVWIVKPPAEGGGK